jgi:hypothetical protein
MFLVSAPLAPECLDRHACPDARTWYTPASASVGCTCRGPPTPLSVLFASCAPPYPLLQALPCGTTPLHVCCTYATPLLPTCARGPPTPLSPSPSASPAHCRTTLHPFAPHVHARRTNNYSRRLWQVGHIATCGASRSTFETSR